MWTETTTIHPAAWSDKVESDLRRGLGDIDDESFDGACASAREQLAAHTTPCVVTLFGVGTALVVPVDLGEGA